MEQLDMQVSQHTPLKKLYFLQHIFWLLRQNQMVVSVWAFF
jgi:hypothetical protein